MIKDKKYFVCYGMMYILMDEILVCVVVDISGCLYLFFNVMLSKEKVGMFDMELVEEFFRVVVINVRLIMYIDLICGGNIYYEIEVIFKVFFCVLGIVLIVIDD